MGLYDEVEIEDMDWDQELHGYTYSCPCGDLFQITVVCSPGLNLISGVLLLRAVLGEECFCMVKRWPGLVDTWLADQHIKWIEIIKCSDGPVSSKYPARVPASTASCRMNC